MRQSGCLMDSIDPSPAWLFGMEVCQPPLRFGLYQELHQKSTVIMKIFGPPLSRAGLRCRPSTAPLCFGVKRRILAGAGFSGGAP